VKCVNCWGDHTANFSDCPARLQYLAKIGKIRQRSRNIRETMRSQFRNAPELNDFNPALNNPNSSWTNTANLRQQPGTSKSMQKNLFTPTECMSIFNELITNLSNCTTKFDQLRVLDMTTSKMIPFGRSHCYHL
jgi:hypothetical protein